jgi:gliding motility-associated-like protein
MRLIYFLFSALFLNALFFHSNAQHWGRNTFGQFTNEAVDVEVDGSGNSYITGYLSGETAFQTDVVILGGYSGDAYVAKYDQNGTLLWIKTFGGNFSDRSTDLAIAPDGNVVFTGQFFGTATFGAISLNSPASSKDIFVAKLSPSGTVIWAFREGGTDAENAYGLTVDNQNNVILTGQFKGTATIAGQVINSAIDPVTTLPSFDFFVSKYDENAVPLWVKSGHADYEDRGLAVQVDDADNIFMTGQFSDTLIFCGNTYNNMAYNLGFVTKLSPSGNLLFLNKIQAGMSVPWDLKVDDENRVVVAGDFLGNMNYFDQTGAHLITNPHSKQGFLIKLENDGTYIWDYTIGSENPFSLKSIAIDVHEDVYATGWFECTLSQLHDTVPFLWNSVGFRDPYLLKVTNIGDHEYIKQFGGKLDDEGHGIALLEDDQPVICGMFKQDLTVPLNPTYSLPWITSNVNQVLHPYSSYEPYDRMEGDNSANSFLLSALDQNSADYNYFLKTNPYTHMPADSLSGFIGPNSDTVHFCYPQNLYWDSQTYSSAGPGYNYLWNTGDSTSFIPISTTGDRWVNVDRIDECSSDRDSTFAQLEEIPPLPLLTDDHNVNIHQAPYDSYHYCFPDTMLLTFDTLPPGVNFTFSSYNNTVPSFSNNYSTFPIFQEDIFEVVSSNQYCYHVDTFKLDFDYVLPYNPIDLGIIMNTSTGPNDSITICLGDHVWFRGVDYFTNPSGGWLPFTEPVVYFDFNVGSNYPNVRMHEDFTSTGWKVIELELIVGYMNLCGVDTVHYFATDSFYVHVNPLPTFNTTLSGDNLLCPNGSIFIKSSNTDPNLNWNGPLGGIVWTSSNQDSIEVSLPGIYTYSGFATDTITLCSRFYIFSDTILFKQPPMIVSNPEDGIICPNDSVLFSLPNNYVDYVWIGPNNDTLSLTNTCYGADMGSYYCHLIDDEACPLTTLPAHLFEYSTPSIYVFPSQYICPGEEVTIGVTYSGEPSFVWFPNGETTDEITVTQAGIYSVQINQCGIVINDTIEIFDGGISVSIETSDTLLCANEIAFILGSIPGGSYEWNDGQVTGASYQIDESGAYFATVTNEYGCSAISNTIDINHIAASIAPEIDDLSVCPQNMAELVSPFLSYWFTTDSILVDSSITFSLTSVMSDTSFLVAYLQTECPLVYSEVSISIIDSIGYSPISVDSMVCSGQGISANITTDAASIEWFMNGLFLGTSNPISLSSSQIDSGGLLTVQLGNECMQTSASDSIFVHPQSIISTIFDTIQGCFSDTVQIYINENFSVQWEWGAGVSLDDSLSFIIEANPVSILVSATDNNGCLTNQLEILVQNNSSAPLLSLNDTSVCPGSDLVINSTVPFNWYTIDTLFVMQSSALTVGSLLSDTTLFYSDPSNPCGLILQDLNINLEDLLTLTEIDGENSICFNEIENYSVSTNGSSIDWFINGASVGSGITVDLENYVPQLNTTLIAIASNSCQSDTSSFEIDFLSQTQISANVDTLISCAFETNQFFLNQEMNDISWTGSFGTESADTLIFTASNSTDIIYVSGLDTNECPTNQLSLAVIPSTFSFDFFSTTLSNCMDDSMLFSLVTTADTFMISTPFGIVDTTSFTIDLNNSNSGNYVLWLQDYMGCEYTDTLVVDPFEIPVFELSSDTVICLNDIYSFSFPSDSNYYSWGIYGANPNISLENSQYLTLTALSPQGCVFIDSVYVLIVDCDNQLPNVITPNGDNINDYLLIDDALAFPNSRLIIQNRYGNVVFEAKQYQNDWNGENCVDGVYFYTFDPDIYSDIKKISNGFVQVIR